MRDCPFKGECDLWKQVHNPCIPYSGAIRPQILFVGEAPGEEEDWQNANFVGRAGNQVRAAAETVGFNMDIVAFTNVVKCRPIDYKGANRTPKETEIKRCHVHVLAEIEALKPKMVILLGGAALSGVLGKKGITNYRGQIIVQNGITYIPTWHPAAVLRDPGKEKTFVEDIDLCWKTFCGEIQQKVPQVGPPLYTLIRDKAGINQLIQRATDATECAFDVETHPALSPYVDEARIICVNLSFVEREAFVIPWFHSIPILTGKLLEYSKTVVKEILESSIPKVAHNGKYDMMWLEVVDSIIVNNFDFDTILAQYLITQERGTLGLEYLAWKYTDMGGYDRPLAEYKAVHPECNPSKGGSYANIPWEILFPYAAGDPDCTLRCKHILKPMLGKTIAEIMS